MDITICDFQFYFNFKKNYSCTRSERYSKFTIEKCKNKKKSINYEGIKDSQRMTFVYPFVRHFVILCVSKFSDLNTKGTKVNTKLHKGLFLQPQDRIHL